MIQADRPLVSPRAQTSAETTELSGYGRAGEGFVLPESPPLTPNLVHSQEASQRPHSGSGSFTRNVIIPCI